MRIIAGTYRSRLLKSTKDLNLRPTSDYLRETLFNVLGPSIAGSRFLDLFAGTGAVGIEALSRGAIQVTFIENHAATAALIRENLASLKITTGVTVIAADVLRGLQTLEAKQPLRARLRLHLSRPTLRRRRRIHSRARTPRVLQNYFARSHPHRRTPQNSRPTGSQRQTATRTHSPPRRFGAKFLS